MLGASPLNPASDGKPATMPNNSQQSFDGWVEPDSSHSTDKPAKMAGDGESGERVERDFDVPATASVDIPVEPPNVDIAGWNVYIVDAHSLIFQVFHALPEMTSPRGEHVAAVYGFVRDILQIIEQKQPDALICAFDHSGPTFRDLVYDRYKADRGEMPDELVGQIPKIQRVLTALAIPVLGLEGFEADDILATVAKVCDAAGAHCFIVSGDKDCRQLITNRVVVYNIRKNEVFDAAALLADWGVRPDQVVDFQSLVGDQVDNVPGVPTIGPKTASTWLQKYETLDNLLDHAAEIPGAKGQKLVEGRESALLSRQLVRLDSNVPIRVDWSASRIGCFDHDRLAELFAEFGFRSFGERVAKLTPTDSSAAKFETWNASYQLVDTPDKLAVLIQKLAAAQLISLDTETTHVSPCWAELVGLSFATAPGEAYYIPVRGPAGERVLDAATTLAALKPVLENPAIAKLGQNLKYDIIVLRNAGIHVAGTAFDTMIASYLVDAGERNYNLDDLADRYLGHTTVKIHELIGKGKTQKCMDEVPLAQIAQYAAEDADVPLRLHPLLAPKLADLGLTKINDATEVPLIEVLAEMELNGVQLDRERLADLSARYTERLKQLEIEIERLAGHPLNIASPKQLAQVLFQELKLPVLKKTKTGPSTDADVLEQLAEQHPLPAKIVEFRQFSKLKSTYVDALPEMIHPKTLRVHTSFNQVIAATGRLSSSDPNLQNIPIRTEEGREIRSAFIAAASPPINRGDGASNSPPLHGEGRWTLLCADYSQIELRVLAHFSEDSMLCEAFARDDDIHTLVASQVYGVPPAEVNSAQRRSAKAVNFGIIYGQSPFGLAKSINISQEEAAEFIAGYFARYQGVAEFFDRTLADCSRLGYVTTILGRRRAIQGVRTPIKMLAGARRPMNLPERTAVNTVIQGSAADLIKLAMIAIHRRLREEKRAAKMILQIHDELVFEVPESELDAVAAMVRSQMADVLPLRVPLKVDVTSGHNWAACEPWIA
jgi:DNA polymerase-1